MALRFPSVRFDVDDDAGDQRLERRAEHRLQVRAIMQRMEEVSNNLCAQ